MWECVRVRARVRPSAVRRTLDVRASADRRSAPFKRIEICAAAVAAAASAAEAAAAARLRLRAQTHLASASSNARQSTSNSARLPTSIVSDGINRRLYAAARVRAAAAAAWRDRPYLGLPSGAGPCIHLACRSPLAD